MTEIDLSHVRQLERDLELHARRVPREAVKIVARGALNIKRDWRAKWSGLSHAPSLAASITYETKPRVGWVSAEIGADKGRRQGALANLIEFGSAHNAPQPGGAPALEAEAPRFEKAIADLTEDVL